MEIPSAQRCVTYSEGRERWGGGRGKGGRGKEGRGGAGGEVGGRGKEGKKENGLCVLP